MLALGHSPPKPEAFCSLGGILSPTWTFFCLLETHLLQATFIALSTALELACCEALNHILALPEEPQFPLGGLSVLPGVGWGGCPRCGGQWGDLTCRQLTPGGAWRIQLVRRMAFYKMSLTDTGRPGFSLVLCSQTDPIRPSHQQYHDPRTFCQSPSVCLLSCNVRTTALLSPSRECWSEEMMQ